MDHREQSPLMWERRLSHRVESNILVRYILPFSQKEGAGLCKEMSIFGLRIESKEGIFPEPALAVEILFDDGPCKGKAHVLARQVWCEKFDGEDKYAVGLKFIFMDEEARQKIHQYIYEQCPSMEPLSETDISIVDILKEEEPYPTVGTEESMPPQSSHILVVDDEEAVRNLVKKKLDKVSEMVTTAKSGEEAIQLARQKPFDLVFTDIKMPGMNGIEVLKKMKEVNQDVEVVMMTGFAGLETSIEAVKNDAFDYLVKPFENLEDVVQVARRALEKQRLKRENKILLAQLRKNKEKLEEYNRSLEQKVQERTRKLRISNEKLRKAYKELKSLDKAKMDFIALMSHEMQTPLSIIMNSAEILLDGSFDNGVDQKEMLLAIKEHAEDLSRFTRATLEFIRLNSGKACFEFSSMKLKSLVEEDLADIVERMKAKNLQFEAKLDESIKIYADRTKIVRALTEILDNAIKFTPEGGRIQLRATIKPDKDEWLKFKNRTSQNKVVEIVVEDNGQGIPQERLATIFNLLQTGEDIDYHTQGRGLGLAICKAIIVQHGGSIWAESDGVNQGTRVFILLPLARENKK